MKSQIQVASLAIEDFLNVESLMHFVEKILIEDHEKLPDSTFDLKSQYNFISKLGSFDSILAEHSNSSLLYYEFIMEIPSIGARLIPQKTVSDAFGLSSINFFLESYLWPMFCQSFMCSKFV